MKDKQQPSDLMQKVETLGINRYQRHIFLCAGEKCCSKDQGDRVWNYLKSRCQELGLTNQSVFRTKAHCLRVCQQGPIAVVYPEGTWYSHVDEDLCEKIIQQHLIAGEPVSESAFAQNGLDHDSGAGK